MKVVITSIGTRGDMEPFLAIGEILQQKGHEVVFAFPEQYTPLIPKTNRYFALNRRFVELVEGELGRIVMGGKIGFFKKIKTFYKLYKEGMAVNKLMYKEQYEVIENEKPDIVIYHGKCVYPIIWHLKYGKKTIFISPVPYLVHSVQHHAHLGFGTNWGSFSNKMTYHLANFGLIKVIFDAQKLIPQNPQFSKKELKKALFAEKMVYSVSPTLFERPNNWAENVQVLGYHERNKTLDWQPDETLTQFLHNNPKVLFLTFGSMINPTPTETSRLIFRIFDELKIAVIVNTAAGGLVALEEYKNNPLFHFVNQIPYDWILAKVYAMIHHGGSGTTHSGLKYGCSTMIIPHIIDQFVWNNIISNKGAGPKGIAVNKLTHHNLKPLIADLANNETYKHQAQKIAHRMREEDWKKALYDFIVG